MDFIVNRFFMKLFKTNNIDVVKSCQLYFGFSLPSEEWVKRAKNLDAKYIACKRAFVYYENLYSPHNSDSSSDKIDTKYYGSSMFY